MDNKQVIMIKVMAVNAFSLSIVILANKTVDSLGGRKHLDCVKMVIKVARLDNCQFIVTANGFYVILNDYLG